MARSQSRGRPPWPFNQVYVISDPPVGEGSPTFHYWETADDNELDGVDTVLAIAWIVGRRWEEWPVHPFDGPAYDARGSGGDYNP